MTLTALTYGLYCVYMLDTYPTLIRRQGTAAPKYFLHAVKSRLCFKFGEGRSKIEVAIMSAVAGHRTDEHRTDIGRTPYGHRTDIQNSGDFIFCLLLYIALDRQKNKLQILNVLCFLVISTKLFTNCSYRIQNNRQVPLTLISNPSSPMPHYC